MQEIIGLQVEEAARVALDNLREATLKVAAVERVWPVQSLERTLAMQLVVEAASTPAKLVVMLAHVLGLAPI